MRVVGRVVHDALQGRIKRGEKHAGRSWSVYLIKTFSTHNPYDTEVWRLKHYADDMLEWQVQRDLGGYPVRITITGTWTGWGSVSDQTGVNAALRALGSTLYYARDIRGGGARIA
jgi:hypothetical protein